MMRAILTLDWSLVGPLGTQHRGIAVVVDDHVELDRTATHGAVLDEPLPASPGGIDADVVCFRAARAHVAGVGLEGHGHDFGPMA